MGKALAIWTLKMGPLRCPETSESDLSSKAATASNPIMLDELRHYYVRSRHSVNRQGFETRWPQIFQYRKDLRSRQTPIGIVAALA
jgi:hypothetical protein